MPSHFPGAINSDAVNVAAVNDTIERYWDIRATGTVSFSASFSFNSPGILTATATLGFSAFATSSYIRPITATGALTWSGVMASQASGALAISSPALQWGASISAAGAGRMQSTGGLTWAHNAAVQAPANIASVGAFGWSSHLVAQNVSPILSAGAISWAGESLLESSGFAPVFNFPLLYMRLNRVGSIDLDDYLVAGQYVFAWEVLAGSIPGVSLNPATGVLNGTPIMEGRYPMTVEAENYVGTGSGTFTVVVAESIPRDVVVRHPQNKVTIRGQ